MKNLENYAGYLQYKIDDTKKEIEKNSPLNIEGANAMYEMQLMAYEHALHMFESFNWNDFEKVETTKK